MRASLLVLACAVLGSLPAQAADKAPKPEKIDWAICDKEVKDYGCKGSDQEIWSCLEQKDADLGDACQKEHRKGDRQHGIVIAPGQAKELK